MVMEEYQGLGYRSNELQQLQLQLATAYLPMRSIDAVINVMYLSNSLLLTSILRFLPFCLHLPLCFCPNNKIDVLITGNGLDLHCGLKSSFKDFFDFKLLTSSSTFNENEIASNIWYLIFTYSAYALTPKPQNMCL